MPRTVAVLSKTNIGTDGHMGLQKCVCSLSFIQPESRGSVNHFRFLCNTLALACITIDLQTRVMFWENDWLLGESASSFAWIFPCDLCKQFGNHSVERNSWTSIAKCWWDDQQLIHSGNIHCQSDYDLIKRSSLAVQSRNGPESGLLLINSARDAHCTLHLRQTPKVSGA